MARNCETVGPAVLSTSNEGKNVEITLVTRETDGYSVVEVSGEVDVYTAPQLDEQLSGLVEAGSYQLVVDLSAVEFLYSTGLGVLVKALKRVREHGGSLAVVTSTDRISKVFRITGLDTAIGLHSSVDEAVAG